MGFNIGAALTTLGSGMPAFTKSLSDQDEEKRQQALLAMAQAKAEQEKQQSEQKLALETKKDTREEAAAQQAFDVGKYTLAKAQSEGERQKQSVMGLNRRAEDQILADTMKTVSEKGIEGTEKLPFNPRAAITTPTLGELSQYGVAPESPAGKEAYDIAEKEAARLEREKNPTGLGAGRTALYNLKWEKAKEALGDMPEGPEKEKAIFYMVSSPGTWYGLSPEGIEKAGQKSAETARESALARTSPDIIGRESGKSAVANVSKIFAIKSANASEAAAAMQKIYDPITKKFDASKIDPQITHELSMAIAKLVAPGGGQPAEGTINELTQSTAAGDLSKLAGYLGIRTSSKSWGTTPENLMRIAETIDRLGVKADNMYRETLEGKLTKYEPIVPEEKSEGHFKEEKTPPVSSDPVPKTQVEYDKIPVGTYFIDTDGKRIRKEK